MSSWRDNIRKVDPYVPGEQPQGDGIIKLNTNENPYPPSPMVEKAIRDFDAGRLSKYPDPASLELVRTLASYHGVGEDQVFVGTGSDDVLATAFLTFFNSDREVVFPDVTYSFYPVWASVYGISYREIPLDEDLRIRTDDYMTRDDTAVEDGSGAGNIPEDKFGFGGVVIANPNAPTGIFLDVSEIERIVSANQDCVVIVDEAYIDYGGQTSLPLTEKYDNLLIVRTFSKSRAMAGARIGYAIGHKDLIQALNDVAQSVNSYTMTAGSLLEGVASVRDDEYFRARIDDVVRTREKTISELKRMGFEVLPSSANFIFAKPSGIDAKEVFESLRENRIYVRYFSAPRTRDYLRITIGTDAQMDRFLGVLSSILG